MKKLGITILFLFLYLSNVSAKQLNLGGAMLPAFNLKSNTIDQEVVYYENNETKHGIYSLSPEYLPNGEIDYQVSTNEEWWNNLETSTKNKIIQLMRLSNALEDYRTYYTYIVTQEFIWKTLAKEVEYQIQVIDAYSKPYLTEAEEYLKENFITPEFVKEYEITTQLEILNTEDYEFWSDTCQIKTENHQTIIQDCLGTNTIHVKEKKEENIIFYQNENQYFMELESAPCEWEFTVLQKQEEKKPDISNEEESYQPQESTEEKEEVPPPFPSPQPSKQEEPAEKQEKTIIENVPNTASSAFSLKYLGWLTILLWLKKH